MKRRKVLALVLTFAMIMSTFSIAFAETEAEEGVTTANPTTLHDVNGHWAKAAIYKWSGNGIISGYQGLFRPNDSITRGEMAVILDNMMNYQVAAKNTFMDLKAGQFYTDAVLKANAAGIIKGDGNTVRPTDKISREEAAVILARAFAVKESTNGNAGFNDASSIAYWAKGYVTSMAEKGYLKGSNNNFQPKLKITRAEIVTIIDNIVKAYYTKAGTFTEDVNGTAVIKVSDVTLKGVTISENLIIAEGVGQGDVTLDSVTVKGETVVRGGGENSVHITGNSNITSVRIERIGDRVRIVVADGSTVTEMEVAEGEEIIISGTVGTLDVIAPNTTIIADNANIVSANISGNDSTITVSGNSRVGPVTVASTASNTTIQTESGAVVGTVTASARTTVSGQGTVSQVTLNEGANNSSITTPRTQIAVGNGVTGATGGGGTAIPSGSTGTNNSSGNGAIVSGSTPTNTGGGGGSSTPTLTVNGVSVINASTITFSTAVAGATIKWNDETLEVVTTAGDNIITVPLMVSGVQNKLEVIKSGYIAFTKNNIVYTEPYYTTATLGTWVTDRTEPKSWIEADNWITLETKTEPNNNWYAWQGKKSPANIGLTSNWKVETQLELTNEMVARDGIRASVWLQVEGSKNFGKVNQSGVIDWAILQFKKDSSADTAGWQAWNSEKPGTWENLESVPTIAGIYTLTMIYEDGTLYQYIDKLLVNSYDINPEEAISAPTYIMLQSYSFGESYTAKWKVPTVKYVMQYPADAKIVSTVDELKNAVNNALDGDTVYVAEGEYNFTEQFNLTKPITIEGIGNVTFKSNNDSWSITDGYKHLLGIYGGTEVAPINLKNIVIDADNKSHAVNTYNNAYGILNNVTIKNGTGAGLTVNGSTIIADNLNTSGNAWGAVNVDPGDDVNTPSVFTLTGTGVLSEDTQIWSDGNNVSAGLPTVTVNAVGYTKYLVGGTEDQFVWYNRLLENVATITNGTLTTIYSTIQAAINDSTIGDTILVAPGEYALTSLTNIHKDITLEGVKGTTGTSTDTSILKVSGTTSIFNLKDGAKLNNLTFVKTDDASQNIIQMQSNSEVSNCMFTGTYTIGGSGTLSSQTTLAIEMYSGASNVVIHNNVASHLRQLGYINGSNAMPSATITDNFVSHSRGIVLGDTNNENAVITGNRWGLGEDTNQDCDIYYGVVTVDETSKAKAALISSLNNNALVKIADDCFIQAAADGTQTSTGNIKFNEYSTGTPNKTLVSL